MVQIDFKEKELRISLYAKDPLYRLQSLKRSILALMQEITEGGNKSLHTPIAHLAEFLDELEFENEELLKMFEPDESAA